MDRKKELKKLIADLTELAESGHVESQQKIINAQIELDEIAWFDFEDEEIEQAVRESFYTMPESNPIVI
jgi:hypothetical protein